VRQAATVRDFNMIGLQKSRRYRINPFFGAMFRESVRKFAERRNKKELSVAMRRKAPVGT
jgi:hypothetical protein